MYLNVVFTYMSSLPVQSLAVTPCRECGRDSRRRSCDQREPLASPAQPQPRHQAQPPVRKVKEYIL